MAYKAVSTEKRLRVFVAAPMSGYGSNELYVFHLKVVLQLCHRLEETASVEHVYFAGRDISSVTDFTSPLEAFKQDYSELQRCNLFLMYYPLPVRSSVLVEAGIALGLGKNSFYACQTRAELPYLLVNASQRPHPKAIPPIAIYEWGDSNPDVDMIVDGALSHVASLVAA